MGPVAFLSHGAQLRFFGLISYDRTLPSAKFAFSFYLEELGRVFRLTGHVPLELHNLICFPDSMLNLGVGNCTNTNMTTFQGAQSEIGGRGV